MYIHLRSTPVAVAGPSGDPDRLLNQMRDLAANYHGDRYVLTDDPSSADLILFLPNGPWTLRSRSYFEDLRRDPVCRRFRHKSLMYSDYDYPIPFVPGIFPSIEKSWYWRSRSRPGPYLSVAKPLIESYATKPAIEPRLLASFVGCMSNQPVRYRMRDIRDDSMLVVDNTEAYLGAVRAGVPSEMERLHREYAEVLSRSKFILCPRGYGPSSYRLFEAMQMGRVPVIVSDQWVQPDGPDWDAFSLRVKERDVLRLPEFLRNHEAASEARGLAARQAWERWFSPEQLFVRICETCEEMLANRKIPERLSRWLCYLHFARPSHVRAYLRGIKDGLRRNS